MKKKTFANILFAISLAVFLMVEKNLLNITGVPYILDKVLYYNEENIRQILGMMGENGRSIYQYLHLIDFIFISAFAFMQLEFMKDKLKKVEFKLDLKQSIFLIPIIIRALSDVFENLLIDTIIINYPDINFFLAKSAYLMSFLKWLSLSVIIIQILYLVLKSKREKAVELCTD